MSQNDGAAPLGAARGQAEALLEGLASQGSLDAHVHLGFMLDAAGVARDCAELGLALFANTVTPQEYRRLREELGDRANVRLGVGLHPWWLADGRAGEADAEAVCSELVGTDWVGEIGLDLSPRHGAHELQLRAFTRICEACGEAGGKVMSIHAVRSAEAVLDVLERSGCTETCLPILHWFSGSTEALRRAVGLGVHFSVNEMQASTRRAKEQLRLIPEELLLFETDLPPGEGVAFSAAEIAASLGRARERTRAIRSAPRPARRAR